MKAFKSQVVPSVSRDTFITLFVILVLILMAFPLMSTFNDMLTRVVINLKGYVIIREYVVPFETRLAASILYLFGAKVAVTDEYIVLGDSQPFIAEIVWNCIGWQSILFFVITALIGLQGDKYTAFSKFKAFLIGVFGTFLVNIFRIAFVVLVAYYFGQLPASIVHDYGSLLATIGWLFGFWWFVYSFVLEERNEN